MTPSHTLGVEKISLPVSNRQSSSPLSASSACRNVSVLPKYTVFKETAGEERNDLGLLNVQRSRPDSAFTACRFPPALEKNTVPPNIAGLLYMGHLASYLHFSFHVCASRA